VEHAGQISLHGDDITRTIYATDNSIYQVTPSAVALPHTAEEVVELVTANASSADPAPITARGGGTGTNGQSLTTGICVDLKRNLNRIVSIDPASQTATVEPGVVAAQLNEELAPHNLMWAPHTSTLNRATIGGMIATDAAGKGSLVHGRTHSHVRSLEAVLADGTLFRAEPITVAEARQRANLDGRVGEIWQALLELPLPNDLDLPELARGFSGYGIDRLRRNDIIDPLALFVGAEGTLGITVAATLSLTPIAAHKVLIAAFYENFTDALDDSVELRASGPAAIECFDERTLEAGRSSPAWPALESIVKDRPGSMLLVEYESGASNVEADPAQLLDEVERRGRAVDCAVIDSAHHGDAWKVRADAVGLVARTESGLPERSARPTAFVEDCAVPVEVMSDFIAEFREVLDAHELDYAMFGHADVGCVHVRPALDLTDPAHESLVRRLTDEVTALVAARGGLLWGEHGRGFRGDVMEVLLSQETIVAMRRVKSIFDPTDLMNPGKLYRPVEVDQPLVAVDEAPLRGQLNRSIPVEVRRSHASAFACNGNGLCQQYSPTDPMCPSYQASGDPALSPKGRADLIRSWLYRKQRGEDGQFADAVAANLNQCLSCSACAGRCPVEVDIPELKSRFFDSYYEQRRRPASHMLLSRFEELTAIVTRAPRLAGLLSRPAGSVLGLVDLPVPNRPSKQTQFSTFKRGERATTNSAVDVVVLRDVFTAMLEPDTIEAAAEVLTAVGLTVQLAPFVPSGKFDHVKGKRTRFARAARTNAALVNDILTSGATPVAIEPAVALLHEHEYPAMVERYPTGVRHLAEVLHDKRNLLPMNGSLGSVSLLGHCTERSLRPDVLAKWAEVLNHAGYAVTVPELGCCGMAGIFGHEAENVEVSERLWRSHWDDAVAASHVPAATGWSCRSQAARFGSRRPEHPVHLVRRSLDLQRSACQ